MTPRADAKNCGVDSTLVNPRPCKNVVTHHVIWNEDKPEAHLCDLHTEELRVRGLIVHDKAINLCDTRCTVIKPTV